jgi:dihydroneopterin aldolase
MTPEVLDAVIVGAGPAGCSAASWLAQSGLRACLIEKAAVACPQLEALDFAQDWVLGSPGATPRELGRAYAAHLVSLPGADLRLGRALDGLQRGDDGLWDLQTSGGAGLRAHAVVLATGLRPRRPATYFEQAGARGRVLDALELTACRATLAPASVLVLGGGDNAAENALYLHEHGHRVTVWTRGRWRAQPELLARLDAASGLERLQGSPAPELLSASADGLRLRLGDGSTRDFDLLATMFGFDPEPATLALARAALRVAGLPVSAGTGLPQAPDYGLIACGDAAGGQHPCIQTALADGVRAAKQVLRYRETGLAPAAAVAHKQVLRLDGLRFNAPLGWLEREKGGPQRIEVNAALNMEPMPLKLPEDDLAHVLDYGRVRQIVIEECTAQHIHLVETLLGKLCRRLQRLPGVKGVRVQVTKLEVFDDCQVGISAESGQW